MSSQLIQERLTQLRQLMKNHQVDAWIVPSADPHLSEYLPDYWQQRVWLSGFTGSVGTVIVTENFAGLWVDSRYWEQAKTQLQDTGIELMKSGEPDVLNMDDWLAQHLPKEARIGFNPFMMSLKQAEQLEEKLAPLSVSLFIDEDFIATLWQDRPTLPTQTVYVHDKTFVSQSRPEKLANVREMMRKEGADWHFISSLDDIAWLFNLRGSDVEYNPVFLAHALISQSYVVLFVPRGKISREIEAELAGDGVLVKDYVSAGLMLGNLPKEQSLWIDPDRVALALGVTSCEKVIRKVNSTRLLKAEKTPQDIAHIRQAMEQDGAALCEFFAWFEAALERGDTITELTIDEQICQARARQAHHISPSFATIAGFNANGAMPHYQATSENFAEIKGNGLLLIDSGGQYLNGTTDITRVVPVGEVSAEQKRDYTAVLKGMIALSRAVFPRDYPSALLDTLARTPLWQMGLDYGHGTGHGVGYFLNVHEGPQVIAHRAYRASHLEMKEGMVTSNEPGVYRAGKWGIRIENLVVTVAHQKTEFVDTLKFETLTLCPIDTRCIDKHLMTQEEIDWLNTYHAEVLARLKPLVKGDALDWLVRRTQAI
ncbi:aminopeptidase P family protein [Pelistega sp. NLN82]|uniref:Aminopeptidase P family protein n=1 Tax=Pelistega ratti TaxID=2652177 RepID=A0A6L9Y514_9BURK|nr:aminopeptidase P family protein [Pelistega ratti]NEN75067.1 aminopeptidase P family protein [Pelistega ratti]